jgi:hypothetical protein
MADASYALCAKVGSAIGMDDLARNVAHAGHRKSRMAAATFLGLAAFTSGRTAAARRSGLERRN